VLNEKLYNLQQVCVTCVNSFKTLSLWLFSTAMSQQEESQSTPALVQASDGDCGDATSSLSSIPENNLLESYTRLSISLEDNGLFKVTPSVRYLL